MLPSAVELGVLGLLGLGALGPVLAAVYLTVALRRGPGDGDSEI
jgi:hypothetical protein